MMKNRGVFSSSPHERIILMETNIPPKEADMDYKNLTPEQMEKAKACKSTDELVALAKSEGIELNDQQLDAISGGNWCSTWCGSEGPCVRWFPK